MLTLAVNEVLVQFGLVGEVLVAISALSQFFLSVRRGAHSVFCSVFLCILVFLLSKIQLLILA